MNFKNHFLTVSLIALLGISCGDGSGEGSTENEAATTESSADPSTLMEIEGKLFSIPSPVQTAFLIKEVGTSFDESLLNSSSSYSRYSTSFKKAINLGIYGADLGYATIYDQNKNVTPLFVAVKTLGDDLGVSGAFDKSLLERFEKNIGNKDSLLSLVADAFRASDAFLKNNERNDIGALVLAGGWVESLHFSTSVATSTKNDDIIGRIGAQKNTCNNLVKLLMPYYNKSDYTAFIDQLMELNEVFQGVEMVYTYKEPTTNASTKTTKINSVSEIRVSDEQLQDITNKIKIIREQLIS